MAEACIRGPGSLAPVVAGQKLNLVQPPWPGCFALQPLLPLPALDKACEPSRDALMPSAAWWCFSSGGLKPRKSLWAGVGSRVYRMPVGCSTPEEGQAADHHPLGGIDE